MDDLTSSCDLLKLECPRIIVSDTKEISPWKTKRILLVIAKIQTKLTRIARQAQRKGNYVI